MSGDIPPLPTPRMPSRQGQRTLYIFRVFILYTNQTSAPPNVLHSAFKRQKVEGRASAPYCFSSEKASTYEHDKTWGHQNLSEGLATSILLLFHQTISRRLCLNYCVYPSYMTGWQIKGNKRPFSRKIKIR